MCIRGFFQKFADTDCTFIKRRLEGIRSPSCVDRSCQPQGSLEGPLAGPFLLGNTIYLGLFLRISQVPACVISVCILGREQGKGTGGLSIIMCMFTSSLVFSTLPLLSVVPVITSQRIKFQFIHQVVRGLVAQFCRVGRGSGNRIVLQIFNSSACS